MQTQITQQQFMGIDLVQFDNCTLEQVPAEVVTFCEKMMQAKNADPAHVTFCICVIRKTPKYWKLFAKDVWKDSLIVPARVSRVLGGVCVETGNIFKSASSAAMAKGVRGNVFSADNGTEALDGMGYIRYLR